MKRRSLLKALGLLSASGWAIGPQGLITPAHANISTRALREARALVMDQIGYSKPSKMPQIISIFMYGGPSELGANLTNMEEINAKSLNKYSATLEPGSDNTVVTKNGFWGSNEDLDVMELQRGAGGQIMERMIKAKRLSIYRTMNRIGDDNTKAHRTSIFSDLTGLPGEDDLRPGIGTNIASILHAKGAISEDALFPFVTMEGESLVYNQGETSVAPYLKPLSLDQNLNNPYKRGRNSAVARGDEDNEIESIAQEVMAASSGRYGKVIDAFNKRSQMASFIEELDEKIKTADLPNDPDIAEPTPLQYPDPRNNSFSKRVQNAVNLMVNNPDTMFVSLGTGGLGGWDDHNNAIDEYSVRLRRLFQTLEVAAKHLEAAGKDNIVIVLHGDFGRNANLNGSMGWDHGNNQNLYIVGAGPSAGSGIPGQELGKLVGTTKLIGNAENNRLYTSPSDDSYQFQPYAVAATLYKYFGIENPEALTGGVEPIDETGSANEWVDPTS